MGLGRLDLQVEPQAGPEQLEHLGQGWRALPFEARPEPAARVELAHRRPGRVAHGRAETGRPLPGVVVHEHQHAVGGALHVHLGPAGAQLGGETQRRERVLGSQPRRSTVRHHEDAPGEPPRRAPGQEEGRDPGGRQEPQHRYWRSSRR